MKQKNIYPHTKQEQGAKSAKVDKVSSRYGVRVYFYTNLLAWALVFLLAGNYAFGWTTPSATPPSSNLPAPINVSSTEQTKAGNLIIGGNLTTTGLKMTTGAGADKVLISDASGLASWATSSDADTWITTQTCSTDYALQSVGKTTKTCINKVDYSDIAYDVSCTNCLTNTEVASADYATDADKLDGYHGASASTVNTYALRNASGDINSRLFRSEYDTTNATIGYIMTQIDTVSNNYIRPSTPTQIAAGIYSPLSTYFLRSNADDTFTGKLSVGSTSSRSAGIYGIYDSYKTGHIWSMGASYAIPNDGSTFGNLYGLAYKHTNNTTGGTMAGGHQMVWVVNGVGKSAMGTGLWTSGAITGATINTGYGAKEIGDSVGNCAATDVHKGDGGCEAESSLSVGSATTASDVSCTNCLTSTEVASADLSYNLSCTGCVAETEIAQNTLDDSEIQDNSLTAGSLAAGSVGTSEVADNTLTATDLAANACGNSELIDNPTFTTLYIGSTDSYFYRDAANRIATPDQFYVQAASAATYLYSTNTYLGADSGDTIHTRGNVVNIGANASGQDGDLRIINYTANALSDGLKFYEGTTRMGEIGCEDTTWLRINQETAKNIYTPRYIRADAGFFVDGTTYGISGTGALQALAGSVGEAEIAQNTLDDSEIQDNSLTAGSLAANSCGDSELIASPAFTNPTAATPTSASHVATKAYVDNNAGGTLSCHTVSFTTSPNTETVADVQCDTGTMTGGGCKNHDNQTDAGEYYNYPYNNGWYCGCSGTWAMCGYITVYARCCSI